MNGLYNKNSPNENEIVFAEEELMTFYLKNEIPDIYYDTDMDLFLHKEKKTISNKSFISSINESLLIVDKTVSFRKLNSIKSVLNIKEIQNKRSSQSGKNSKKSKKIKSTEEEISAIVIKKNNIDAFDSSIKNKFLIKENEFKKLKNNSDKNCSVNVKSGNNYNKFNKTNVKISSDQLIFKLSKKDLKVKSNHKNTCKDRKSTLKVKEQKDKSKIIKYDLENLSLCMKISSNEEIPYYFNNCREDNIKNKGLNRNIEVYKRELKPVNTFNLGMKKKPKLTKFSFNV